MNSLLEELNCETVFTIPVFGGIGVSEAVVVTWIIMAVLVVLCLCLVRNLKVENPGKKQLMLETAVSGLYNFFEEIVGEKGRRYIPYLSTVAIYIGIANLIGLFGFKGCERLGKELCRAVPDYCSHQCDGIIHQTVVFMYATFR